MRHPICAGTDPFGITMPSPLSGGMDRWPPSSLHALSITVARYDRLAAHARLLSSDGVSDVTQTVALRSVDLPCLSCASRGPSLRIAGLPARSCPATMRRIAGSGGGTLEEEDIVHGRSLAAADDEAGRETDVNERRGRSGIDCTSDTSESGKNRYYGAVSVAPRVSPEQPEKERRLTVVILLNERHPVLDDQAEHADERHARRALRERGDLAAREALPDGPAQEVPEHVAVAARVLCALERGRRARRAPQLARQQLHREHGRQRAAGFARRRGEHGGYIMRQR
jgi:hypothetical protein